MPNKGPSDAEWRERIRKFAAGEFNFQRGQRPSKDSVWGCKIEIVSRCPLQLNRTGKDVFGRTLNCNCGYHNTPSTSSTSSTSTSPSLKKSRFHYASSTITSPAKMSSDASTSASPIKLTYTKDRIVVKNIPSKSPSKSKPQSTQSTKPSLSPPTQPSAPPGKKKLPTISVTPTKEQLLPRSPSKSVRIFYTS